MGDGDGCNVPAHFLGSSFVEFYLINSPYCTLDILNSHETFVKTKIMSNCVLQFRDGVARERESEGCYMGGDLGGGDDIGLG